MGAALDAELDARKDTELWDQDQDEAEEIRRAVGRSDSVKGTQSCNGEYTDNTTAEEDAHRGASGCGAGWMEPSPRRPQRLSARAMNPKDTELSALSQRVSQHRQVLEILHHVSLHRCVGLLQHAPEETLASLL